MRAGRAPNVSFGLPPSEGLAVLILGVRHLVQRNPPFLPLPRRGRPTPPPCTDPSSSVATRAAVPNQAGERAASTTTRRARPPRSSKAWTTLSRPKALRKEHPHGLRPRRQASAPPPPAPDRLRDRPQPHRRPRATRSRGPPADARAPSHYPATACPARRAIVTRLMKACRKRATTCRSKPSGITTGRRAARANRFALTAFASAAASAETQKPRPGGFPRDRP